MTVSLDAQSNVEAEKQIQSALDVYAASRHEYDVFVSGIAKWFTSQPSLNAGNPPLVHSVKWRLKDSEHLREKLRRKYLADGLLRFPPEELGMHVTDLAGLRVLHLDQRQFGQIHSAIMQKVYSGDWYLAEKVKAYTWDPESRTFFESLQLECLLKDTFYTSVHYIFRPRSDAKWACEVQVRTLFEEIWGEVDHSLNYPSPTTNTHCEEQLRVLAKFVGAGSRLVESIFKTANPSDSAHEFGPAK